MPLYDYVCPKGHTTEVRHGFDDTYDVPCPVCGEPLKRVFNPAPILFKGSGFYVTDSRSKSSAASAPSSTDGSTKSEPAKTESAKSDSAKSDSAA